MGDTHWLSTVALGLQEQSMTKAVDSMQGATPPVRPCPAEVRPLADSCPACAVLRWFYLGVSIGPLLQLQSGAPFVKAVLQLLEEFQYHFARSAVQNMKVLKARGRRTHSTIAGSSGGDASDLKPTLQRQGGEVLYAYLLTPHLAHPLSASQVLLCLCELLPHAYRKFVEVCAGGGSAALAEAVCKIDGVIEELVLSVAAKHYNGNAAGALQQALGRTDPLFARLMDGGTNGGDDDGL